MCKHSLISEYPLEYFTGMEFGQRILAWISMCGINTPPDPITEGFVIGALQDEYAGHSFEEVELALRMYVMGELGDDVEAYNNFNLKFLSKVMRTYRKHRKDVALKYNEIKAKLEKPKPVIPTEVEKELTVMQTIWEDYIRIHNDIEVSPWEYKCDLLLKYDIIKPASVELLLEQAREVVKNSLITITDQKEKIRLTNTIADPAAFLISATTKAKGFAYMAWLQQCKKEEKTFIYFEELAHQHIINSTKTEE